LHPDLLVIEREGASISVDKAREIIRLATRSPVEGDRKVLVLVDFHLVTNAGPTLLKIIEEPPASTVFVILAEHVPRELVTIASRCVQVSFGPVPLETVVDALIAEGADPEHALRAARASAGRLDRARLLVNDDSIGRRLEFWEGAPRRLDGTGAAVAVIAAEAATMLDSAAVGPLEARQRAEVETIEARLEAAGGRAGIGVRKELVERHKRELKRLRDDELRFGLSVLQRAYRDALVAGDTRDLSAVAGATALITEANRNLERNPNVTLLLQNLLLALPALR
jgi:DNA polymerase-3 subunit delta'